MLGMEALLRELEDQTKATYKYLSVTGSPFAYDHCPEDVKTACPKQKPKVSYIRYLAWFLLSKGYKGSEGRKGYKK